MVEDGASLTQEPGPAAEEGRPTEPHGLSPSPVHLGPPPQSIFFLNQVFYLCLYLILVALDLHCCVGVPLVAAAGGYSYAGRGLLIAVPSLFRSTGSRAHGLQELQSVGSIDAVPRL